MPKSKLPKHLLVVRSSAMGDVAMLPHALRALREAYPELRITVLTRKLFAPFFTGLGVEFLFIDTKGAHKSAGGILRLAGEIRRLGVDAVADCHDVLRSQLLRSALRVRGVRVSSIRKGRLAKWLRMGSSSECVQPLKHSVVRYCDTIRRLGFQFEDPAPALKPAMENPMGEKQGRWVGVAPFSAHRGKIYPEELMARVVQALSERYERVFIHSGGGKELQFAKEQEAQYGNVTALNGRVDLKGELELISHLDCVVSMDSLVMHMASLVATPVVSVWGATHPKLGFLGYGCSTEGVVQRDDLTCRPCSVYGKKPCKYKDYRCMTGIAPEEIVARVEQLIGPNPDEVIK